MKIAFAKIILNTFCYITGKMEYGGNMLWAHITIVWAWHIKRQCQPIPWLDDCVDHPEAWNTIANSTWTTSLCAKNDLSSAKSVYSEV